MPTISWPRMKGKGIPPHSAAHMAVPWYFLGSLPQMLTISTRSSISRGPMGGMGYSRISMRSGFVTTRHRAVRIRPP